ncbi:hypothetical protein IFM89_027814 [Coptis chinensis]|uniref:Uncharacterized protein n=1 Tax=Coptis chinensis TaxID=261450 RepID=A0A835MJH6_9MAGN|nr:hypothetical protein IFM89_027814 [Coptis chinensis]
MDTGSPEKKVVSQQEQTRESLIAISNPDTFLASKQLVDYLNSSSTTTTGRSLVNVKDDEAEKCRSELISISYTQSPDAKPLPN